MSWLRLRRWWLVSAVLGVLGGILWWAITDTATWTITKGGTSISNDETRLQFGAIVSFVLNAFIPDRDDERRRAAA